MRVRFPTALAALVALGALLRFATLDVQSLWNDEAVTALLLDQGLGGVLADVPDSESTPPLYYAVAWLWSQAFGTGEVGLRSLSALCGTAAVAVVALLARRVASERAALIAAALAATSPLLVWYSQEARAYALLVLLVSLSLLALAAALLEGGGSKSVTQGVEIRPTPGEAAARAGPSRARPGAAPAGWAAASALALATHYFAAFVVAPAALALLAAAWRGRLARGPALGAVAAVGATGLALLPLALDQAGNQGAAFIEGSSLAVRAAQVPKQLLVGFDAPAELAVTIAAAALAAYGGWLLLARAGPRERRRALALGALGAVAVVVPLLVAAAGADYVLTRNLIAAWPALAVALAAGFGARRARRAGVAAAAALAALGAAVVVAVALEPRLQRDDWRSAAEALGPAQRTRAVVLTPPDGRVPLTYYLPGARPMPEAGARAAEIDVVALAKRQPGERAEPPRGPGQPPAGGFAQAGRVEAETFTLVRWRLPEPIGLTRPGAAAARLADADAEVLVQPAGARPR